MHSSSFLDNFLRTGDNLDLGNAVGVTEDDTDLRGSGTLLGQLADLVDDLIGGGLQPSGSGARVGDRGGRNTLSVAVKSTHLVGLVVVMLRMRICRWSIVKFKRQVQEGLCGAANFSLS